MSKDLTIQEYTTLKRAVDNWNAETSRKEGALEQLRSQLAKFNCETLEEAEVLIKQGEAWLETEGQQFALDLAAFKKEYDSDLK